MRVFGRFRRRVLAHGLVIVLLMASAVALTDRLFVNRWVEHELVERRARVSSKISIYGADGDLLASNVEPPIPPPPSDVVARLAVGSLPMTVNGAIVSGVFRDRVFRGVVVRRLPPPLESYPGPPLPIVFFALAVCMAATLLASIPLSRAVVHPVEALARSVKRFGAGELGARASLAPGDEIGDLAAAFDEMAARIESLVRSEKQLLANVSHELRTPLARIRVVLELASDGDPERVRSYHEEIAQDLAELEALVEDVLASARLDLSAGRLESGNVAVHWTRASLAEVVEKSRARFGRLHPSQSLELTGDGASCEIDCDPNLLRHAVDNLLENAAKHAPGAHLELHLGQDEGAVAIDVVDDGPGMSTEGAARAFEPFYRDDASRDRRTGGVGLGLSIVRRVVEAHGGQVTLGSSPGRGTKVAIRLPRRAPPRET